MAPNNIQQLDEVDRALVQLLRLDGRMPNNELASRVGIAPSTCLTRLRKLRDAGVIRGFHADVDPAALGRPIQAMIAVQVRSTARGAVDEFVEGVQRLPAVQNVYFVSGSDDFLVHVAVSDTNELRALVSEDLGSNQVLRTETKLIFDHFAR
ncbi:Lrp/AsnC family transcriptional regulator [Nocardioides sp. LS1]|uniref:Lrp/AsnC family transcriptional regulator n=1 Tax=Nocardioides sp. LS1 TaxID=1027620 RepID=UPI000FF95D42|nr:Lrp/AsnC family transcriptional regulator [Nocardioides sp. LS1]GCD88071.1 AsnC family transcriptional regulator [Nocardioides sp. LS1]